MKTRTIPTATSITAIGAIALMALTGCSASPGNGAPGGGAEAQPPLFEFQSSTYGSAIDGDLTIRIPDALIDSIGSSGEVLVPSVHLTARGLDGSKFCAIDIAPEYAGEGFDALNEPSMTKSEFEAQMDDEIVNELSRYGVESVEDAEKLAAGGGDDSGYIAEVIENIRSAVYTPEPAWGQLRSTLPAENLDESDLEEGAFLANDGSTITFVQRCALEHSDDATSRPFTFPIQTEDGIETIATVELTIMKSGAITVTSAEVNGFTRDADGNWIGN